MRAHEPAPFIFRIAGWPVETIQDIRSSAFSAEIDLLIHDEAQVRATADELSRELHREVALAPAGETRALLLSVRRALYRTTSPLAPEILGRLRSIPDLSTALAERLANDEAMRRTTDAKRRDLKRRYGERVAAERHALFTIAAQHRFRNALIAASPIVAARWERLLSTGSLRADRKLTATLWAYAMRAVGRATPNGLWAGVSIEDVADRAVDGLDATDVTGEVHVKPNLNLFDRALRALRDTPQMRRDLPVRRNPTLTRLSPATWTYLCERDHDWIIVEIADDGALGALLTALDMGPATGVAALAARSGLEEEALLEFLDSGVLWPAITWPAVCSDPWKALEAVCVQLPAEQHRQWRDVIEQLREICRWLSSQLPSCDPTEVARAFSQSRTLVDGLLAHCGATLPDDACPLIVDWVAPFSIGTGRTFKDAVLEAVRRCYRFDRGGTGELLARAARRALSPVEGQRVGLLLGGYHLVPLLEPPAFASSLESFENVPTQGWEAEVMKVSDERTIRELLDVLHRWTTVLGPAAHERSTSVSSLGPMPRIEPMPPGAALVSTQITDGRAIVRVGSIAADICTLYSRFDHLFDRTGNAFRDWVVRVAATLKEVDGLQLTDYAVHGLHDRNAALRPRLTNQTLDPFGGDRPALDAAVDDKGRLHLHARDSGRRIVPLINTAADLRRADPFAAWIQAHGQLFGRPSLLCPLPALDAELSSWRHLPRLTFDGDVVISAERWHVPPESAATLVHDDPFEQFVAWRGMIAAFHLPELVYAHFGLHDTEALISVDSVLAADIVSRSVKAHPAWLHFQEAAVRPETLWLRDSNGAHYVAEMAVAWSGDDDFWRDLAASPVRGCYSLSR